MDRGAWQATLHGIIRVGHDLATKPQTTRTKGLQCIKSWSDRCYRHIVIGRWVTACLKEQLVWSLGTGSCSFIIHCIKSTPQGSYLELWLDNHKLVASRATRETPAWMTLAVYFGPSLIRHSARDKKKFSCGLRAGKQDLQVKVILSVKRGEAKSKQINANRAESQWWILHKTKKKDTEKNWWLCQTSFDSANEDQD